MKSWRILKELLDIDQLRDFVREQAKNHYGVQYQEDLYAYIEDNQVTFYIFTNVGGNSWLDDDHFTLWRFKPDYSDIYSDFRSDFADVWELLKYMEEYYNVVVDIDKIKEENGIDDDDQDALQEVIDEYIIDNYGDEIRADCIDEIVDEEVNGIVEWIMERINQEIRCKEEEVEN